MNSKKTTNPTFKKLSLCTAVMAALATGLASSQALAAAPGAATIDWMETNFAIIEINESASAYTQLVTVKDFAEVPVAWSKWSGDPATSAKYLLNNNVVLEQTLSASSGTQTGNATLQVATGGQYTLDVQLCNADGCTSAVETKNIKIEDTDGSHMAPLVSTAGENNQPFDNKTNSVVGSYFVEWGVYGRNYPVDKIPAYNLTHVLYGFIPICGPNESLRAANPGGHGILQQSCSGLPDYSVTIHDMFAAVTKTQAGQVSGDSYRGNFGQLMAMKKAYPDLKILPSVGGWTLSDPFYDLGNAANRATFVNSVETFLRTWKFFDGVDIDWEFPGGGGANASLGNPATDGETYRILMRDLRAMLDTLEGETGRTYELSSAVSASKERINLIDYNATQAYMDHIFVMTYDFFGAWDNNTLGHQTGVYAPELRPDDQLTQDFNLDTAINTLLTQGVEPKKLVAGVAMYGRGWTGVSGFDQTSHLTGSGTGPVKGTWEAGVVDYREIAQFRNSPAWSYHYDTTAQAPYIFNASTGDLISYDDATSVQVKGAYVRSKGLGGLFSWEIDADNGDILNAMHESLGHGNGTGNIAPNARAGVDQTISNLPATVTLNGSASTDADGDTLTYSWAQTAGTAVSLSNANSANASFSAAPVQQDQTLTFTLTVSDGQASATDSVNITLKAASTGNTAPVANAGADQSVAGGAAVTLNGAASSDADGDTLTYQWQQTAGTAVTLNNATSAQASFTAPTSTVTETLEFALSVDDGQASSTDSVLVTVQAQGGGNPCDATDPDALNHAPWSAGATYTGGATVSHNSLVWQAAWWNQGSEPSAANSAWNLLSNVEFPWNASVAYNGGDQVNHNGRRYQAGHWTQGDQPGSAAVWSDIGPASCN